MFGHYLSLWKFMPDGEPIATPTSRLLPVRAAGAPAMLKIATAREERRGGALMVWWKGEGAARVLAADGDALLLERACGPRSLADLARRGRDGEATGIICDVIASLHAPRAGPPPELIPLPVRFGDLEAAAGRGGVFARAAQAARSLLAEPRQVGALHGNIHHGNVLDFEMRGWLAIDPKGLWGERGFDYANLSSNPDLADPFIPVATSPARFARRLEIVVARSGIDARRLLRWIVAWSGLSAAWLIADGGNPEIPLTVAELAIAELDR